MSNILLIFHFIFHLSYCFKNNNNLIDELYDKDCISVNNGNINSLKDKDIIPIEPGISKTYFINYLKDTIFNFNISEQDTLQINIHSINCNIKLDFIVNLINQINLNTFSIEINSTNNNITIFPLIDIIEGEYKENYEQKSCPLSINSYLINNSQSQSQLKIENKEKNIFYLSYLNPLNISYNIKEILNNSFITLSFQFNEENLFLIDITYINNISQIKTISKKINNSSNIFLNSEFFLYEKNINKEGVLYINIINKGNKALNINFKLIEKDTISLLEKDALNFGFITSETIYQYYYTEISKGEEGELILHNKRLYGLLHAKIVNKKEIKREELYNSAIYPKEYLNKSNYLLYNQHSLELKYNEENTFNCFDGCYLLITYEQKKSERNITLIGYEFTILSRTWNYTDYISQIIDIPFNEYIIGVFNNNSINHHYYAITIPDDIHTIIIQLEGNYLDGFYSEGRKKINTMKPKGKNYLLYKLDIFNNKNVLSINLDEIKFNDFTEKERNLSFAFRRKDYFDNIFSFYYFRILGVKNNQKIFYPIDSNFGNLCSPEKNTNTNLFYCYLVLKNNYNEFSTQFSITSSNQNNYFKINILKVYKNGKSTEESREFIYNYEPNKEKEKNIDIDYFLFIFEFRNNEIMDIISSFSNQVLNVFPQIYSSQMFYLDEGIKECLFFKVNNNYILNFQYLYGNGDMLISFLDFEKFYTSRNFRGKPMAIPIDNKTNNITFNNTGDKYIFYYQLIYNMENRGIEEIISGKTRSQFMMGGHFPLYYYLKINDNSYINVDVNLRLNSYDESVLQNNFDIKGYILNEENIKRKIRGEYIELKEPINGYYSNKFKVGLLQVNQPTENENNTYYLLIEILNLEQLYFDSCFLVELVTKENNQNEYFMPINQYILETFNDENNTIRSENKYYISVNQRGNSQVLIDLSPEYNDIEIKFENESNLVYKSYNCNGFKRYRIWKSFIDNIFFNVINKRKRNANYMIRYFYTNINLEYNYSLNNESEIAYIDPNEDNVTVSITFDCINMVNKKGKINDTINFYISGLLFNKNIDSEELINTTSILHEQKPLYENKTNYTYTPENSTETFSIIFKDISRKDNYIYILQLQVNAIIRHKIFNEEFLIFTTEVDLTNLTNVTNISDNKGFKYWILFGIIIGFVVFVGFVIFFICYYKLRKKKTEFEEKLKSMAYSHNVEKNVIIDEQTISQRDLDFETTFI